jgi:hypothetical protein
MRVVIQKKATREFYVKPGVWSISRKEAWVFNHSMAALEECSTQKLQSADVVLSFRDVREK